MEEETPEFLYSNFIGDQNELSLDKNNYTFEKYLQSCIYSVSHLEKANSNDLPKLE